MEFGRSLAEDTLCITSFEDMKPPENCTSSSLSSDTLNSNIEYNEIFQIPLPQTADDLKFISDDTSFNSITKFRSLHPSLRVRVNIHDVVVG